MKLTKSQRRWLIALSGLAATAFGKLAADTLYLDDHDVAGFFFRVVEIVGMVMFAEVCFRVQNEFWDEYNRNKRR